MTDSSRSQSDAKSLDALLFPPWSIAVAIAAGVVVAAVATVSGTPLTLAILMGIPAAAITWVVRIAVRDGRFDLSSWTKRSRRVWMVAYPVIIAPAFFIDESTQLSGPIELSLQFLFLLTASAAYALGLLVGTLNQMETDDTRGDPRLYSVTPRPGSETTTTANQ